MKHTFQDDDASHPPPLLDGCRTCSISYVLQPIECYFGPIHIAALWDGICTCQFLDRWMNLAARRERGEAVAVMILSSCRDSLLFYFIVISLWAIYYCFQLEQRRRMRHHFITYMVWLFHWFYSRSGQGAFFVLPVTDMPMVLFQRADH